MSKDDRIEKRDNDVLERPKHILSIKLRRCDATWKRCVEHKVKDTGVYRSQHRLLMNLNHSSDCSQAELAERLEISPAAVTVSLKKLEKGGYIRREKTQEDNRVTQPVITDKGKRVIEDSINMFMQIENQMFEGFTEEEMQQLGSYLDRICDNLGGSSCCSKSVKGETK